MKSKLADRAMKHLVIALGSASLAMPALSQARSDSDAEDGPSPDLVVSDPAVTQPEVNGLDRLPEPNPFRPRYQIRVGSETVLPSSVDGTGGNVTVQRISSEAGVTFMLSKASRLSFAIEHESSFYTFDGTIGLTPVDDDPVGYLQQTTLKGRYTSQLNEEVGLSFGGSLSAAGEPEAELGDSLVGRAFVASSFNINDRLTLGIGLALNTRLENSPIIVPIPTVVYRASERLTVSTQERGLGARYSLNETVTLRGIAGIDFRQYRLAEGEAGLNNGIFQETAIRLGTGVDWQASPRVGVGLDLDFFPYRQLEFQDSNGVRIRKRDTDPSVSIGFTVRARF